MFVSIIVPVLNEAESLPRLFSELAGVMDQLPVEYEIVVLDDGSTDGSGGIATEHGARVLRSERNVGKSRALQAGFDATKDADVVITMDGDLQDDPAEIPRMLEELNSTDLVNTWKADRKDSRSRRVQSRMFGAAVRKLTGVHLQDFNSGFKAYRREVLDTIELTGDQHRLIPVLAAEAGFDVKEIPVNHRPREHGRSRYGIGRAFRGPIDLASVVFISRFGLRPLHILGGTGIAMGAIGFAVAVYLTWIKFVGGESIGDRPLLLFSVLMMLGGLQLFAVGLLGEMIIASRANPRPSPFHPMVRRRRILEKSRENESSQTNLDPASTN